MPTGPLAASAGDAAKAAVTRRTAAKVNLWSIAANNLEETFDQRIVPARAFALDEHPS
jgi:hypothetical protein